MPRIAHFLDLGFVKLGQLMLFCLAAEAQRIDLVQHLPQIIAALEAIPDFTKNLTNLVFDCVRA